MLSPRGRDYVNTQRPLQGVEPEFSQRPRVGPRNEESNMEAKLA
jgi:hypothetical protein